MDEHSRPAMQVSHPDERPREWYSESSVALDVEVSTGEQMRERIGSALNQLDAQIAELRERLRNVTVPVEPEDRQSPGDVMPACSEHVGFMLNTEYRVNRMCAVLQELRARIDI